LFQDWRQRGQELTPTGLTHNIARASTRRAGDENSACGRDGRHTDGGHDDPTDRQLSRRQPILITLASIAAPDAISTQIAAATTRQATGAARLPSPIYARSSAWIASSRYADPPSETVCVPSATSVS